MTNAVAEIGVNNRSFVEKSVLRVLALTLEVGAIILIVLEVPSAVQQWNSFPPWWNILALLALGAPPSMLILFGYRMRPRALQRVCGIQAIAFVVILVLAPVALGGRTLSASLGMPWPAQLAMIAGAAAGVSWSLWAVVGFNVLLQATTFTLVFISAGDSIPGQALGDAIFGVFYVTLLVTLAYALRRAGGRLDRTLRSAVVEARASATADATRASRRRVGALIHDSVIVALLAYSNRTTDDDAAVREAEAALAAIEKLDVVELARDRRPKELAWELQSLTTDLDPDAEFEYVLTGVSAIPSEVASAVAESLSEALRNSIEHAPPGRTVLREIRVDISDSAVNAVILDDGDGFDLSFIGPTRLGVRMGILGRMQALTGGSARVISRRGYGTVVSLTWKRG